MDIVGSLYAIYIFDFSSDFKAVKYNYYVEIVEPNTPWKLKPNILFEKNIHGVNLGKIKKALTEFDFNIDLEKLIAECKSESGIRLNTTNQQVFKSQPKPGIFLSNFEQYLKNVDWAFPEPETSSYNFACETSKLNIAYIYQFILSSFL